MLNLTFKLNQTSYCVDQDVENTSACQGFLVVEFKK